MRTSLLKRVARAPAAALLILSLGLEGTSFAHPQAAFRPIMRPDFVHNHGFAPAARGFSRPTWRWRGGSSWAWRGHNAWNRFARNGGSWNGAGSYDGGFWYPSYNYADQPNGSGAGGLVIVVGAPSINAFPAPVAESPERGLEGGCVIHKLRYDENGKYLGERLTSEC